MKNLQDINRQAKENALTIQAKFPQLPIDAIKKLARFVTFAQLGIAEGEAFLKEKHGEDCALSAKGYEMILTEAMHAAMGA